MSKKVLRMWSIDYPTHGGVKRVYYTDRHSNGGQRIEGDFKDVDEAVAKTGRCYAGRCEDDHYLAEHRRTPNAPAR